MAIDQHSDQLERERAQTRELLEAAEQAAIDATLVADRLRMAAQRLRLARVDAEIDARRARKDLSK